MSDDFTNRVLASIDNIDMKAEITKRVSASLGRIKSIPQGRQDFVLYCIGSVLQESFGLTNKVLASLLLLVNREKCVPPLPDDTMARIIRAVKKRAERKTGCMTSVIACWSIPTSEVKTVEKMIEALPYDFSFAFSEMDVRSPCLQAVLAELQTETINCQIDGICDEAASASKVGVPVDE